MSQTTTHHLHEAGAPVRRFGMRDAPRHFVPGSSWAELTTDAPSLMLLGMSASMLVPAAGDGLNEVSNRPPSHPRS